MMRTTAELRTAQQANISPQLQQAIGLLQLSTPELEQHLREALDSNVFLESDEFDEPCASTGPVAGSTAAGGEPDITRDFAGPEPTLRCKLNAQLAIMRLSDRDRVLAELLVDALDSDGYLTTGLEDLARIDPGLNAGIDEFEAVRCAIQNLEPVGCASLDLGDCLRAQLRNRPMDPRLAAVVGRITRMAPAEWLQPHSFLAERLGVAAPDLARALDLVRRLDPYPGRRVGAGGEDVRAPDVVVSRREGRWVVRLNDQMLPSIRLNRTYEGIVRSNRGEACAAMQGQLQEARWLVKSVRMRNQTLLKVSGAIVARQQKFLERGEVAMSPMVLSDIADQIGMHESTVSRITAAKYIHTPRGMFELKFFFSSRLATRGGGRCSSTAVRAVMRALVDAEDSAQPLSDSMLARMMSEQGIQIARRTVAKYRDALGIPPIEKRQLEPVNGHLTGSAVACV
mgnify:CR=1 FL=1